MRQSIEREGESGQVWLWHLSTHRHAHTVHTPYIHTRTHIYTLYIQTCTTAKTSTTHIHTHRNRASRASDSNTRCRVRMHSSMVMKKMDEFCHTATVRALTPYTAECMELWQCYTHELLAGGLTLTLWFVCLHSVFRSVYV